MQHRQGALKIWFDFLQLAIKTRVPINAEFYAPWGGAEEIVNSTFNGWWKKRGRYLLAGGERTTGEDVLLIEARDGYVVVRIPTDLPLAVVSRRVGRIVTSARVKRTTRASSTFAPSGQVNYKTLAAYRRFLEIEMDSRHAGKTVAEKVALLKEMYARIDARMKKQRQTMRLRGKGRGAARFYSHASDVFDTKDKESALALAGFSPKKAHRWKASGQMILLNVAEGRFPGEGYYGARLAERLRRKKRSVGVTW